MTSILNRRREPVVLETRVVSGTGGGPDKTILNSPRYLWSAGYRTICAYMHAPRDPGFAALQKKAATLQAPLVSVFDRGPWDWRVVTQYLALCRRERVSIWHGHDYKSNALGLLLRRFWPMHLVTTVHGWVKETRRTPLYYAIDRFCLPYYDSVICVSDDLHGRSVECGVPSERCQIILNAVNVNEFRRRTDRTGAKARIGIPPQQILIGAVGRLSPEKGFDLLIRAVSELYRRGYDLGLVIAGEGDAAASLSSLVRELNLESRVRLLGYTADTRSLYEALDLFVLSSLREGLPNVVLEAMAMEAPVVATRVAGVPRLIQDGENGILIEPGSVDSLVSAIRRLLGDEQLRARLAAAGRQTVVQDYSFEKRMDRIRTIYDQLLGREYKNGCTPPPSPDAALTKEALS